MNEVEFLPERIRQRRTHRRQLLRQGYLLLACVAAMCVLSGLLQGRVSTARGQAALLAGRAAALQRQIAMIVPLEGQLAELMIKQRVEQELGSRADCTAVLAELCRVIPANSSLVTLEFKTVKVQVADQGSWRQADPAGRRSVPTVPAPVPPPQPDRSDRRVRVLVTGLAPTDVDVANLMGQLAACPLFENVHMGYSKPIRFRERPAREFEISFYLAR